jgi:hypothetical protein
MRVEFTIGNFSDTLILPDDVEYTDAEIEAMKQQRYDAWWAIVSDPKPTIWLKDANGEFVLDDNGYPIAVEN